MYSITYTFCNAYIMCTLRFVKVYKMWRFTLGDVYVLKTLRFGTLTLCAATLCNITSWWRLRYVVLHYVATSCWPHGCSGCRVDCSLARWGSPAWRRPGWEARLLATSCCCSCWRWRGWRGWGQQMRWGRRVGSCRKQPPSPFFMRLYTYTTYLLPTTYLPTTYYIPREFNDLFGKFAQHFSIECC